jgi:hypothetical protein
MNANSSFRPTPNHELLAGYRALFSGEIRVRKARGMTCSQFQGDVGAWAQSEGLICNGIPWLTTALAAEAYDDSAAFAHDPMTHPQGLLTALAMYGRQVPAQDHEMVVVAWMDERNR